ncbi:MAG: hypothetical protein ACK41V_23715, partial [Acidovorax sp.]|uniref:hypothetical protein n=1 Tax=Acidovorax sp. TaxID=1872122 RepID=UPI00391D3EB5
MGRELDQLLGSGLVANLLRGITRVVDSARQALLQRAYLLDVAAAAADCLCCLLAHTFCSSDELAELAQATVAAEALAMRYAKVANDATVVRMRALEARAAASIKERAVEAARAQQAAALRHASAAQQAFLQAQRIAESPDAGYLDDVAAREAELVLSRKRNEAAEAKHRVQEATHGLDLALEAL